MPGDKVLASEEAEKYPLSCIVVFVVMVVAALAIISLLIYSISHLGLSLWELAAFFVVSLLAINSLGRKR